ncbi:MAG: hypothetical protein ACLT3Y_11005, partial [Ruminococcus callidus]
VQEEALPVLTERILNHLNRALTGIQCSRQFQPKDLLVMDWSNLQPSDYAALQSAGYRNCSYVKQFRTETLESEVHYFMHVAMPEKQIAPLIQILLIPTAGRSTASRALCPQRTAAG